MKKQVIITISREYGSGGHQIASIIANTLGIKMYDRSLIREIAKEMNMDAAELAKFDEKPKNVILSRTVNSHSNSMEDILNEKQAAWLRERADAGDSFVIVGRRGKEVLGDRPEMIKIFVTADEDFKVRRIMEDLSVDEETARAERSRVDRIRKSYHNRYSHEKWGDSRYYDIVINSSKLGAVKTAVELLHYIKARMKAMGFDEESEAVAGAAEKIETTEEAEIEITEEKSGPGEED